MKALVTVRPSRIVPDALRSPNLRHRSGGYSLPRSTSTHAAAYSSRSPDEIYRSARRAASPRCRRSQQRRSPSSKSTMATLGIEESKRTAAQRAAQDHFDPAFTYVGIGSGTTIIYVVDAIKALLVGRENPAIRFVPTGYQSRQVIVQAGLQPLAFDELADGVLLDVAFDGADEVDEDLNCIKGGGACLFQEKLVAERARKFICVADYRKAQTHLLTAWPSVPIEIAPVAAAAVLSALRALGSPNPRVRDGLLVKAGPLKTDQDFFIIDAPFPRLLSAAEARARQDPGPGPGQDGRWGVEELCRRIKAVTGVLEVGLFCGWDGTEARARGLHAGGQKPVAVYFGMKDGSVQVRRAQGLP